MVRINEVRKGQADPTPMMQNIIVIPHEGSQPFKFEASGQFRLGYIHLAISRSIHRSQRSGFGHRQSENLWVFFLTPTDSLKTCGFLKKHPQTIEKPVGVFFNTHRQSENLWVFKRIPTDNQKTCGCFF